MRLLGSIPGGMVQIADTALPPGGEMRLGLYRAQRRADEAMERLLAELRGAYGS
jgi:hypothetical protein